MMPESDFRKLSRAKNSNRYRNKHGLRRLVSQTSDFVARSDSTKLQLVITTGYYLAAYGYWTCLAIQQNASSPNLQTFYGPVLSQSRPGDRGVRLCGHHQLIQRQKFLQNGVRTPLHLRHRAKENRFSRIQKHHTVCKFFRQPHVVRHHDARKMQLLL
jgi:hypothetical protein